MTRASRAGRRARRREHEEQGQGADLRGRLATLWPMAIIAAAILMVFARTVAFQFLDWDDNINVYQNPAVVSPSWDRFVALWTRPYGELYVPLVYTSYLLDMFLGGGAAWAFHLTNVLLHIVSACTVYLVLQRITAFRGVSVVGALLFALHPLQAEPVAWITGRKDVLCGMFMLLALWQYGAWLDHSRWRTYVAATLLFALSLLSKPSGVVTPVMAIAMGLYCGTRPRRLVKSLIPWFVMSAIWVWITISIQGAAVSPDAPFSLPWWRRPLVASDCLVFYAGKIAIPWGLTPIYPRTVQSVAASGFSWLALGLVVVALAATMYTRGGVALGVSWYVIPLLPVLGFTTFFYQYFSTVADRYCYVALAGIALVASHVLGAVARYSPAAERRGFALAGGILVALGLGAFVQTGYWHTSESLWNRTLAIDPSNLHARQNLASDLAMRGNTKEARAEYERILALDPAYAKAYTNLMRLHLIGQDAKALADTAARAVRLPADSVDSHMARGQAFLVLGRYAEAAESFRGALAAAPADADAWDGLGAALLGAGDLDGAGQALEKALALIYRFPPAHANVGMLLALQREYGQALEHLRLAVSMMPEDPQYAERTRAIERASQGALDPDALRKELRPVF